MSTSQQGVMSADAKIVRKAPEDGRTPRRSATPRTSNPIRFPAPSRRVAYRWALRHFWGTSRVGVLEHYRTMLRVDRPGVFWALLRGHRHKFHELTNHG